MADKRGFKTLVASMDRKAKELSDYLQQPDANIRIAKSKSEKLRKDMLNGLELAKAPEVEASVETLRILGG